MSKSKKVVSKPVYLGDDPAKFLWSSRTHRSASEAFRDADYATPIWRCESDWDRTKQYLGGLAMLGFLFGTLYLLAVWFESVI